MSVRWCRKAYSATPSTLVRRGPARKVTGAAAGPAGGAPAAGRFGSDSTCVGPPPVGRSGPQNRPNSNAERYRFYTRPVALASALFGQGLRPAVTAPSQHGHSRPPLSLAPAAHEGRP